MITKLIKVCVKPGHLDAYLATQELWNRETRSAPGYLGCACGRDPSEPNVVYLQCFWRSREDLERWMEADHDRIAAVAKADEHYTGTEVRVLDSLLDESALPFDLSCEETAEAAWIQTWSELYRSSAALRIGVKLGLFERLKGEPSTVEALASALDVEADPLHRLLLAVSAMGLVACESKGWHNTPLADRTLVAGAPAYQGDMVLHNTQPEYIERVFKFGERLDLPPDVCEQEAYHPLFLKAMGNTAAVGQTDVLVSAVDLAACRTMLDVGGATGFCSIALCRAYPELHAVILDQPETLPLADPILQAAGLGDRVRIEAHDYLSGPFPGPVDVVLISNVLRGETPAMIDDILRRVRDALEPGGRLVVTDLFTDDPRANVRLRAALFGLHLVDGANYSLDQMAQAVDEAGFELVRVERLGPCVVMNGVIVAKRSQQPLS